MRMLIILSLLAVATTAHAQQPSLLPPRSPQSTIVLDHGAPTATVLAVAFSPDGQDLYTGGLDKAVRHYRLVNGQFTLTGTYPIPIGPGNAGAINAIAVSPDGRWVAVAGRAPFREEATFGETTTVVVDASTLSMEAKQDYGVVYLFDAKKPMGGGGRVIRGQRGEVRAMTFAQPDPAGGSILITAGTERTAANQWVGSVHGFRIDTGMEIGVLSDLPVAQTRPGLVAWPTGKGEKDIQVAIAWPKLDPKANSELIIWDIASEKTSRWTEGRFNTALLTTSNELWSGSLGNEGQLVIRSKANPGQAATLPFPRVAGMLALPRVLASGGPTLAGVIEIASDGKSQERTTQLRLFTPQGQTLVTQPLSGFPLDQPLQVSLAVSANGRYLAVSGFRDHRVEIYEADGKRVQIIPGIVNGFTQVAFLKGNNLWLGGPDDRLEQGGVVFDFAGRKASTSPGKLVAEAPKVGGPIHWKPGSAQNQFLFSVGGQERVVQLRDGERPTAAVVIPARSLLAVAHTNPGDLVTAVTLFDIADINRAKPVRHLIGPNQVIVALAVSANHQLLAGVSSDRSVTVWTLKDVDHAQGAIAGLVVTTRNKQVVVSTVEVKSEVDGLLAAGDIIEAVGPENGELKAVTSGHEFRNEVGARPIGSRLRVRRVRGKAAAEIVVLKISRALVQRDPLFSVWVDTEADPQGLRWVGWSPTGLYDASSQQSESRIGWHTSTGDPAQPATVVGMGQFRKALYKRTILQLLADHADLDEAVQHLPIPEEPRLLVEITPSETVDGISLLRTKQATLRLAIRDPDGLLWLNRAVIQWRIIGTTGLPGDWQDVQLEGRSTIELSLADYPWNRGRSRIEARFLRAPDTSAEMNEAATIVYIPPAPELIIRVDGKEIDHDDTHFTTRKAVQLTATVKPGTGSGDVQLELDTTAPGVKNPVPLTAKGNGEYESPMVGLNPQMSTSFKFTARNRGSEQVKEYEAYEYQSVRVSVRHVMLKPAPRIRLRMINAAENPVRPDRPYVVDQPDITLEAVVTTEEKLVALEWDHGDGKFRSIQNPVAAKAITERIQLPADLVKRTIRIKAISDSKQETIESLDVVYAPLPRLMLPELPSSQTSSELALEGQFSEVPAALLPRVSLLITSDGLGESREIPVILDAASRTWKPTNPVVLFPGMNRIGFISRNDYTERREPKRAEINYRRPPLVVGVLPVDAGQDAVGDVNAVVATPAAMQPLNVLVNGHPVNARAPRRIARVLGIDFWQVRVDAVPVRVGDAWLNQLHLVIRNTDGDRGAVIVEVRRQQYVFTPPPVIILTNGISIIQPGQSIAVSTSQFQLGLRVTSTRELTRVEVWQQAGLKSPMEAISGVGAHDARAVPGGFDLQANLTITLREGVNRIRVVAANAGNGETLEFTVTYNPPPVRIVIDGIDEVGGAMPMPRGTPEPGKEIITETGFVQVRGRVVWTADDSPLAKARDLGIVLTANQVVHFPAELSMPEGAKKERGFSAPLFLNAQLTRVTVEVRSRSQLTVPQHGVGPAQIELTCRSPINEQRLHVIVIAPDVTSGTEEMKLVQNVLGAVGGEVPSGAFRSGDFKHRAFSRAILYSPLIAHNAYPSDINARLTSVESAIRQSMARKGHNWVNDVVLIYYQGRDHVGNDGIRRIATSQTARTLHH